MNQQYYAPVYSESYLFIYYHVLKLGARDHVYSCLLEFAILQLNYYVTLLINCGMKINIRFFSVKIQEIPALMTSNYRVTATRVFLFFLSYYLITCKLCTHDSDCTNRTVLFMLIKMYSHHYHNSSQIQIVRMTYLFQKYLVRFFESAFDKNLMTSRAPCELYTRPVTAMSHKNR